jgi:hypothetical protein
MAIEIAAPTSERDLTAFIRFHDEVYASRPARWAAVVQFQLPMLTGDSPFCRDRTLRPLMAVDNGRIVARVLAAVDERYRRLWNERLGHVLLFEALPGTRDAVRALMDEACEWLEGRGADATRAGMGLTDFPFAIEDYDTLPPCYLRQNPAYYHSLLKDAGFETEKGLVDYRIRVTPERIEQWERAVEAARRNGIGLVALGDVPEARRAGDFMHTYNEAFLRHWGYTPFDDDEIAMTMRMFEPFGMLEHSVVAYRGHEAVGALWVQADISRLAQRAPGRELRPQERVNFLGIGVR